MAGRHRRTLPLHERLSVVVTAACFATAAVLGGVYAWQEIAIERPPVQAFALLPPTIDPPLPPPPRPLPQPPQAATQPAPKATPKPAPRPKPQPTGNCPSSGWGGVLPHVARVGYHIKGMFGVATIGGRAGRSGGGEHPRGLALDFMVSTATGNALADYVLANRAKFAVYYVIWRQRINFGTGWRPMANRGSTTANHYDHVHVSFNARGSGQPISC